MALTLWQRIRVAFRVWARRREERNAAFLKQNVGWNGGQAPPPVLGSRVVEGQAGQARAPVLQLDLDGLQAAYHDRSGRIAYFLDVQTGDVVENITGDPARYKPVPAQTPETEAADRAAFAREKRPDMATADANAFRAVLASDRTLERAWYSFKNDRAARAIESWLRSLGLR